MGKSKETYSKKEKEKKKAKKKKEKLERREERKANPQSADFDDMIAYVDEFGNIVDTPPDPTVKKEEIDPSTIQIGATKIEEEEENPIRRGKIDFFNDAKGFGFIRDLDSQDKIFVHISEMEGNIGESDKVTFEVELGPKGPNAVRVKKA